MAERHSQDERLKLKNMLRDAIRVLCQSTVKYSAQVSVEALIGITVDDGSDFLLVSLHEIISDTFTDEHRYQADTDDAGFDLDDQYADMEAIDSHIGNYEYLQKEAYGSEECGNGEESTVPYGTVIKEECASVLTYGDNTSNIYLQPESVSHNVMPDTYNTDNSEVPYYDDMVIQRGFDSQHGWELPLLRKAPAKPRAQVFRAKKCKKSSAALRKKFKTVANVMPRDMGRAAHSHGDLQSQAVNGEDGQIMLYTCGMCGAQLQTKTSLRRHKRTHTGRDLCRCEGCGKVVKRHDNLLRHQNTCAAYFGLRHQQDGFV